jgi:hypothetical protein
MRLWHVVWMAIGVGCSFDSTPRIRHAGPAATSDRNVVGLFYDGGSTSDFGTASDASRSGDASDAADAPPDEPTLQADTGTPATHDSAVKAQDPSLTPDTQSQPMSSDAATPAIGEPMAETPPPASDAAMPPTGVVDSGSTSPRNPMLQLLKAAQFSRDDRALTAILAALVSQAKSGADLGQILATLDSDGQCAFIERVNCLTACGVVATRCSLCISDPDCTAELQHVCGVGAPNCR